MLSGSYIVHCESEMTEYIWGAVPDLYRNHTRTWEWSTSYMHFDAGFILYWSGSLSPLPGRQNVLQKIYMNHRLGDIQSQKSRHPDGRLLAAAIAETYRTWPPYLITSDIDIVKTFEIFEIAEDIQSWPFRKTSWYENRFHNPHKCSLCIQSLKNRGLRAKPAQTKLPVTQCSIDWWDKNHPMFNCAHNSRDNLARFEKAWDLITPYLHIV
jgi:hypothetical protein